MNKEFIEKIETDYNFKGLAIDLGCVVVDTKAQTGKLVKAPLKMFNRHGLISGATGTGKTKTLQSIAGALSEHGVPSLLMDIKGDLSGIAAPGESNKHIEERHKNIGYAFEATGYPVEFLSLSEEPGLRLRTTVSEFGPLLFSKLLELTEAQSSILSVVFKFCDDHGYLLLDLKDIKQVLQFITDEGKEEFEKEYGKISASSAGVVLRKIIELETQGADKFFGEKSFEVSDLLRKDQAGQGIVSILRLTDMQTKPDLFATFMLSLLAEVFEKLPEKGDAEKPELVIFIDEAHLIFKEASKVLLDHIETVVKLIRSKGVGLMFCTQQPDDIPDAVLSQLGMKYQHALRAFTARDRMAIRKMAQNFPESDVYKTEDLLTELGVGEALITVLDEKGRPTELAHTLLAAPKSRMGILTEKEINDLITSSELVKVYAQEIDRESAYEMLTQKVEKIEQELESEEKKAAEQPSGSSKTKSRKRTKDEESTLEAVANSKLGRDIGRTVAREVSRGLLGAIGLSSRRRSTSSVVGKLIKELF